jgi:hypothetical protein
MRLDLMGGKCRREFPKFHMMVRGSLTFVFKLYENAEKILDGHYFWGPRPHY